jgi:hypothetical protein
LEATHCNVSAQDHTNYSLANPPDSPGDIAMQPVSVTQTPVPRLGSAPASEAFISPGLGTRYKTHDVDLFTPEYTTYAE